MKLKTYRANSMADALVDVKRELGKDAVILNTRTVRVGGVLGFGGKSIVEVTASADVNVASRGRSMSSSQSRTAPDRSAALAGVYGIGERAGTAPRGPALRDAEVELESSVGLMEPAAVAVPAVACATPPTSGATGGSLALEDELRSIRRLMGRVLEQSHGRGSVDPPSACRSRTGSAMPDPLFEQYVGLLEQDVAGELADEVVGMVRDELTSDELSDSTIVRETLLRHLASMIPVAKDVAKPRRVEGQRPLTVALVGPTGVGKTTTIAKLAAAYKLRYGMSVGLVTCDTYRIAAVDQLRVYANIIGIPLHVVMTPGEMTQACQRLASTDVILIDTAGRSHNDRTRVDELRELVDAANPHETHLVLASTASQTVLRQTAQNFSRVTPNRVIFTKLDEAVNFGVLLGVARQVDLKLSFVTTGQEVPDHIEPGKAERIARLILEGQLPERSEAS